MFPPVGGKLPEHPKGVHNDPKVYLLKRVLGFNSLIFPNFSNSFILIFSEFPTIEKRIGLGFILEE